MTNSVRMLSTLGLMGAMRSLSSAFETATGIHVDADFAPTLALYEFARSKRVDAFFITGRPDAVRTPTESNLQAAGFHRGYSLTTKPSGAPPTIEYKSGERARIEEELGFEILINVGDQDSDLAGGHARRAFKLPNPMYFIP